MEMKMKRISYGRALENLIKQEEENLLKRLQYCSSCGYCDKNIFFSRIALR
jgi:hypothetical protein